MSGVKGIVLAGGAGTRLHPMTQVVNKQLLPIYDKPMVYYPISVLMQAGIREILIITTPSDRELYRALLGNGSELGIRFHYAVQPRPEGLAQAFIIGRSFLNGAPSVLILGDNIFFGHELAKTLRSAVEPRSGATIFAYRVADPERYGIVTFDAAGRPLDLEEKPAVAKSPWAIVGLYVYDAQAPEIAATLRPSARGELEITDLNRTYLQSAGLRVEKLGRGFAWLDTGTCDSLLEAAEFVRTVQHRQAQQIACLEEIAFRQGWIDQEQLARLAAPLVKTSYGKYLMTLVESE